MALAPVLVERPPGDDARLALLGHPVDSRRDPGQHRLAATRHGGRRHRGSRSPPRRSRAEPPCDPRRRDELTRGPAPARRGSRGRLSPDGCHRRSTRRRPGRPILQPILRPPRPRRRSAAWRRHRRIAATRLGDEGVSVEEHHPLAVARDRQRPLERGRETQRHLDTLRLVTVRLAIATLQTEAWASRPAA